MDHQDPLPSYSYFFKLPWRFFCANTHNSSDLICCSFPLTSAFPPFFPTNGLNGSGSQSATPVGGKITTLLIFTPLSLAVLSFLCFPNLTIFTCTQKGHWESHPHWLRHAGICSHRLITWLCCYHAKYTALGASCFCISVLHNEKSKVTLFFFLYVSTSLDTKLVILTVL